MEPDRGIAKLIRERPIVSSAILVSLAAGGAFLVALLLSGRLRETLQSAAIGLIFVALLGGIVKILLEDFQRKRDERADEARSISARLAEERAERARFVSAMLADLKSVYDRVERARIVIRAHQSAKTYGEEMRDLIDARVQLRNVGRAALARTSGITPKREERICEAVLAMEGYLATLTDEFHSKYKAISDAQRIHEARVKKLLDSVDGSTHLPENTPWDELQRLERLSDFIAERDYKKEFADELDAACSQLREELRALLEVKSTAPIDTEGPESASENRGEAAVEPPPR